MFFLIPISTAYAYQIYINSAPYTFLSRNAYVRSTLLILQKSLPLGLYDEKL